MIYKEAMITILDLFYYFKSGQKMDKGNEKHLFQKTCRYITGNMKAINTTKHQEMQTQ